MSASNAPQSTVDLPRVIPIFPLTGVLLLPRGRLPLNIFEPRYLEMTEDAMASHRMIGIIQPEDANDRSREPRVYGRGCLGRITAFSETTDDRYLITLTGTCRFNVVKELPSEGESYRRVYASYEDYADDLTPPESFKVDRERLVPALKGYFQAKGLCADWEAIEGANDENLVNCLAMACPFDPPEKQALLESGDIVQRTQMMQALLEMAVHERETDDDNRSVQ